jgi:hypothetical protein
MMGQLTNGIWNLNTLKFDNEGLDCESVCVFWQGEESSDPIKIYDSDGNDSEAVGKEYGKNKFMVTINDAVQDDFIFIKYNWWETYDFQFTIRPYKVICSPGVR